MRLPTFLRVVSVVPVDRAERNRMYQRTEQLFRALFGQDDERHAVAAVAGQLGRNLRPSVNFVMVGVPREIPSGPVASQWLSGSVALRLGRGAYGLHRLSFPESEHPPVTVVWQDRRANRGRA